MNYKDEFSHTILNDMHTFSKLKNKLAQTLESEPSEDELVPDGDEME